MLTYTTIWTVFEIFFYTLWISIIVISIYSNYRLRMHKTHMYIQKRSFSLFYLLNASLIFTITFSLILSFMLIRFSSVILVSISGSIFMAFMCLMLYCITVKNWLIYFKYNWTFYTMQCKWQRILTSDIEENNNWFIQNNKTYGNINYIHKLFSKYCFFGAIIAIVPTVIFILSNYKFILLIPAVIAVSLTWGPSILFYAYIVNKTPLFNDSFGIHWESKIHSKLLLLIPIVNVIMNTIYIFFNDFRAHFIGLFTMSIILALINYVSTFVIPKRFKDKTKQANLVCKTDTLSNIINVQQILQDANALHIFMVHLSKEYSMEILLSTIEIIQFQELLKEYITDDEIINKVTCICLPETIPISQIVKQQEKQDNNNVLLCAKIKAYNLFNKYIESMSEFEINIPGNMRDKVISELRDLDELMSSNLNINDLFLIFEDCKNEMISLMTFALDRFRISTQIDEDSKCVLDGV
eukprot:348229_1